MTAYRLGLDLGSTAAKAALLDESGAVLGVRLLAGVSVAPTEAADTVWGWFK